MVKNTIPKPPIQWVNDRQNRMPWGKISTSSMIVAPVVVKPDIVSKKASVKLLRYPPTKKGIVPKSENSVHVSVTTR